MFRAMKKGNQNLFMKNGRVVIEAPLKKTEFYKKNKECSVCGKNKYLL